MVSFLVLFDVWTMAIALQAISAGLARTIERVGGHVLHRNIDYTSYIMARPLRIELPGGLYHVTARGDREEDIYLNE